jgi:hypothetical protein
MMAGRMRAAVALALGATGVTMGCSTDSSMETTPTYTPFVPAQRLPAPAAPAVLAPKPDPFRTLRSVRREEVEGNTWVIADWNPRSVYQIPVAPLEPTILLLPVGESLTSGIVGSSEDLSVKAGATGQRATVALMPNCAAPGSKRFGVDAAKPLAPCMDRALQAAIITDGGVYTVQLQVRDGRAMPVVEINHALPGRSEDPTAKPPQPVGAREALLVKAKSEPPAPWMPKDVWADQEKLVIGFAEPPPTLPALFAGKEGEQTVSYQVLEAGQALWLVTNRRVTEAELRLGEEIVRIGSPAGERARNKARDKD